MWITVWAAADTKRHGWIPLSDRDIRPDDPVAKIHQVIGEATMEALERSKDSSLLVIGDAGCVTYQTAEEALG